MTLVHDSKGREANIMRKIPCSIDEWQSRAWPQNCGVCGKELEAHNSAEISINGKAQTVCLEVCAYTHSETFVYICATCGSMGVGKQHPTIEVKQKVTGQEAPKISYVCVYCYQHGYWRPPRDVTSQVAEHRTKKGLWPFSRAKWHLPGHGR